MTTLKKYFFYRLGKGIPALLIGTALGLLMALTGFLQSTTSRSGPDALLFQGMSLIFYLLPTVYTVREFLPLRQERTRDLLLSVISEHRAFVCHFLSALLQSFITLTAVFGAFSVLIDIPLRIHRFYPILFCLYAMWTFVLCALTAVGFLIGKKLPVSLILALLLPCVGFPVLSIYRGRWDNAPAAYSIMADYLDPRSIRTNDLPSTLALRQTFCSFMVSLALHLVFSILLLVALWFILKWRGRSVDSASPKV